MLREAVHGTMGVFRALGRGVFRVITQAIQSISNRISQMFRGFLKLVSRSARGVARAIAGAITTLGQAIAGAITALGRAIAGAVTALGRAIAGAVTALGRAIAGAITALGQAIAGAITALGQAIAGAITALRRAIAGAITALRQEIARAITALRQAIVGALGSVGRGIALTWRRVIVRLDTATQRFRTKTLTLSVESGQVRAVMLQGSTVVAWKSASLDDNLPNGEGAASVAEPPEEGISAEATSVEDTDITPAHPPRSELSALLEEFRRPGSRLVADLPLYIPLMRHLRLPRTSRQILEEIIQAEVVGSIPFDPFEVDISWLLRRNIAGHEVIAAAVPKRQMDTQVKLFEDAGGSLKAVYSKEAALAFAIGVPDAIIIHLEPAQTAIVLVRDRIPRVVHQLEFPEGITTPEDQAEVVALAVDRVAGFFQTVNPEEGSQTLPVVLTGQLAADSRLAEVLPQVLPGPVLPFAPSLDCPEGFPSREYAANLGLFLSDEARGKTWRDSGPVLNLLPERYRPRSFPVLAVAVFAGLFLLVGLGFYLWGPVASAVQDAGLRFGEKEDKAAGEKDLRLGSVRLRSNARDVVEAETQVQDLRTQLLDLRGSMADLRVRLESLISRALPEGVQILSIVSEGEGFVVAGTAANSRDVLGYAARLRQYRLFTRQGIDKYQDETGEYSANLRNELAFTNATVKAVSEDESGGVNFTILAMVQMPHTEE